MKKKLDIFLMVIFAVCLFVTSPVSAASDFVLDNAGMLPVEKVAVLNSRAERISAEVHCGVYIVIIPSLKSVDESGDINAAARAVYDDYDFGMGETRDGLMLLLAVSDRKYSIYTRGWGGSAFNNYGKKKLSKSFVKALGGGKWYDGMESYLEKSGRMLRKARDGSPVDGKNSRTASGLAGLPVCIILGFLIASMTKKHFTSQLKSVAFKKDASDFISGTGIELTEKYDRFTHMTTERKYDPVEKKSGGADDSGGTSVSGGF